MYVISIGSDYAFTPKLWLQETFILTLFVDVAEMQVVLLFELKPHILGMFGIYEPYKYHTKISAVMLQY